MKSIFVPLGFSIILVGVLLEYGSYVLQSAQSKPDSVSITDLPKEGPGSDVTGQPFFNGVFTNGSGIATSLH